MPCPRCGVQFWPWANGVSHARLFCSDKARHQELARIRNLERTASRNAARPHEWSRRCSWCLEPFVAKRRNQKYCCIPHQNIAKSKRRKARLRGASAGEPISLWVIYERDGGRCGLCGAGVDRNAKWPSRQAPSVDHITPISRGGNDNADNLQLSHLSCNMRKSNEASEGAEALAVTRPVLVPRRRASCVVCGAIGGDQDAWRLYCSRRCQRKMKPSTYRRICSRCGEEFRTASHRKRTCGVGVACDGIGKLLIGLALGPVQPFHRAGQTVADSARLSPNS